MFTTGHSCMTVWLVQCESAVINSLMRILACMCACLVAECANVCTRASMAAADGDTRGRSEQWGGLFSVGGTQDIFVTHRGRAE